MTDLAHQKFTFEMALKLSEGHILHDEERSAFIFPGNNTVTKDRGRLSCTCGDFLNRIVCRHIAAVAIKFDMNGAGEAASLAKVHLDALQQRLTVFWRAVPC